LDAKIVAQLNLCVCVCVLQNPNFPTSGFADTLSTFLTLSPLSVVCSNGTDSLTTLQCIVPQIAAESSSNLLLVFLRSLQNAPALTNQLHKKFKKSVKKILDSTEILNQIWRIEAHFLASVTGIINGADALVRMVTELSQLADQKRVWSESDVATIRTATSWASELRF
jgi:hypothetical protein